MKLILILLLLIPLTATASSDRPKVEQKQSNEAIAAFVNDTAASAISPNLGVSCALVFAIQNKVIGFSWGSSRLRQRCWEQAVAQQLWDFGDPTRAMNITVGHYNDIMRKRQAKRVCLLPLDEHCPDTTYETDR